MNENDLKQTVEIGCQVRTQSLVEEREFALCQWQRGGASSDSQHQ